jgi:hypothetical protein
MTTGLLVVDVQPAYSANCRFIATKVAQRINNTVKPVTIVWVGSGLTDDCEDDVREYLREHGARPGRLAQANFVEKDHGFFRPWMDWGVAHDDIVKVGTHMLKHRVYSSEDVDLAEVFQGAVPALPQWDHLCPPSFDDRRLLSLSGFETCGGGDAECLMEMELWLQMKAMPFKRLDSLVY